jgi:outer membrane biosynthesis protein TonB
MVSIKNISDSTLHFSLNNFLVNLAKDQVVEFSDQVPNAAELSSVVALELEGKLEISGLKEQFPSLYPVESNKEVVEDEVQENAPSEVVEEVVEVVQENTPSEVMEENVQENTVEEVEQVVEETASEVVEEPKTRTRRK